MPLIIRREPAKHATPRRRRPSSWTVPGSSASWPRWNQSAGTSTASTVSAMRSGESTLRIVHVMPAHQIPKRAP